MRVTQDEKGLNVEDVEEATVTVMDAVEFIEWDSQYPNQIKVCGWPTYGFSYLHVGDATLREILRKLGGIGCTIAIRQIYFYGFLWMKTGEKVTFNRPIKWKRYGNAKGYSGGRVTPTVQEVLDLTEIDHGWE